MARASITSNDYVHYATGHDMKSLMDDIDRLGGNTLKMADSIVAEISAKTRRASKDAELSSNIRMGGSYVRKWQPKRNGGGSWVENRGSVWNDKTGAFVSRTHRTGNGSFRLSNFSYETSAWKKKYANKSIKMLRAGYSKVSLTSQVANLWEFDAHYTKDAKNLFSRNGKRYGGWPQGTRKARPFFFNKVSPTVNKVMPQAIADVKKDLAFKWRHK